MKTQTFFMKNNRFHSKIVILPITHFENSDINIFQNEGKKINAILMWNS